VAAHNQTPTQENLSKSLRRMGHAYLRFAEEHPGHYQVLFRTAAPVSITEGSAEHPAAPGFFILVESIQRCLDAGVRPPGGRDATFLAVQVWLFLHGLIDLRIVQQFPFPRAPLRGPPRCCHSPIWDLEREGKGGKRNR
jgi:hypothetical protein